MKVNITFNLEKELLLGKAKKTTKAIAKAITPVTDAMTMGLLLFLGVAFMLIFPITFFLVEEIVSKAWLTIGVAVATYFLLELFSKFCKWIKDW